MNFRCVLGSCLVLILVSLPCNAQQAPDFVEQYREAAVKKWEKDILKLEGLDAAESDPQDAILFLGSSSIRRWDNIAEDMAPWPTIRRGYGGAKFSDLSIYIDRLVASHQFDAVVMFVGNDIAGKTDSNGNSLDRTPEEVTQLFRYCVKRIRKHKPDSPIFFIAITPTGSRFGTWPKVQEMHGLVNDYIATDENLHFIETAESYLGKDGKPNDGLFVKDRLHLNDEGYRIWASLIKKELAAVLGRKR